MVELLIILVLLGAGLGLSYGWTYGHHNRYARHAVWLLPAAVVVALVALPVVTLGVVGVGVVGVGLLKVAMAVAGIDVEALMGRRGDGPWVDLLRVAAFAGALLFFLASVMGHGPMRHWRERLTGPSFLTFFSLGVLGMVAWAALRRLLTFS